MPKACISGSGPDGGTVQTETLPTILDQPHEAIESKHLLGRIARCAPNPLSGDILRSPRLERHSKLVMIACQ